MLSLKLQTETVSKVFSTDKLIVSVISFMLVLFVVLLQRVKICITEKELQHTQTLQITHATETFLLKYS